MIKLMFVFLDTCDPLNASAKACHIIQGGLTVTVDKEASNFDDILPPLFDKLVMVDPNVIGITYIEDPITLERTNLYNNGKGGIGKGGIQNITHMNMFLPVAMVAVGVLGTILVLVIGRPRPHGIAKDDGETSAHETSEITSVVSTTTGDDVQSEAGNKDFEKRWPNPFIIAEEEVSNWQHLGILPISNKIRLECIREETSLDDDYEEMSV